MSAHYITLTPIIDKQNNKLLIPNPTTTNTNSSSTNNNNQFEIYIGGSTLSGALMINSSSIINNDQNNKYPVSNEETWPSLDESLNFTLLDLGDELKELLIQNNKITKVVAGGRHAVICVNDYLIFTIGNNYYNQLGYGRNIKKIVDEVDISSYSDFFVKVNWNLDKNYKVKELICSGNETGVLTSCGKFFRTAEPFGDDNCSLKLIEIPKRIVTVGANWSNFFVMTEKKGYYYKTYKVYSSTFEKEEYQNPIFDHLKDKKNNTSMKLVSGTNSNDFCGLFNEREVRLMDKSIWKEIIVLKTELPIISVTSAYNVTVVFCKKELVCDMQRKLFKTKGLFDIVIKV
ncbi:hypothetical protein ABK040_013417 [Willaertia magna]